MKAFIPNSARSLLKAAAPLRKSPKPVVQASSQPAPFAFAELLHSVRAPETQKVATVLRGQFDTPASARFNVHSERPANNLLGETGLARQEETESAKVRRIELRPAAMLKSPPAGAGDGSLNPDRSRDSAEAQVNGLRVSAPKTGNASTAAAPLTGTNLSDQIGALRAANMARLIVSDQWLGAHGIKVLSVARLSQPKTSGQEISAVSHAHSGAGRRSESVGLEAPEAKAKVRKDALEIKSGEGAAISEKNAPKTDHLTGAAIEKTLPIIGREAPGMRLAMLPQGQAAATRIEYLRNLNLLAEKIQASAQLRNGCDAVLEIHLTPPHLGNVLLRVETEGQEMHLRFGAQSEIAMQMLKEMRSDLGDALSEQGFDLKRFDVERQAMQDQRSLAEGAGWTSHHRPSRQMNALVSESQFGLEGQWGEEFVPRLDFGYNTLDLVA